MRERENERASERGRGGGKKEEEEEVVAERGRVTKRGGGTCTHKKLDHS